MTAAGPPTTRERPTTPALAMLPRRLRETTESFWLSKCHARLSMANSCLDSANVGRVHAAAAVALPITSPRGVAPRGRITSRQPFANELRFALFRLGGSFGNRSKSSTRLSSLNPTFETLWHRIFQIPGASGLSGSRSRVLTLRSCR